MPARGKLAKGFAGRFEDRFAACFAFVALDDYIDIERIDFKAATDALPVRSAAMSVDPEPRNGSSTMSPRLVTSRSASASIAQSA